LEERTINDKNEVKYVGLKRLLFSLLITRLFDLWLQIFVIRKPVKYQWVFRGELQIELLRLLHPDSVIDYFVGLNESLFLNPSLKMDPFQKYFQITNSLSTTCRNIQFWGYLPLQRRKKYATKTLTDIPRFALPPNNAFHFDIYRIS
jgi:hypothetical protein